MPVARCGASFELAQAFGQQPQGAVQARIGIDAVHGGDRLAAHGSARTVHPDVRTQGMASERRPGVEIRAEGRETMDGRPGARCTVRQRDRAADTIEN
jgi:formylmethanofuran:tetrahydromethanopterin formyltransferase